MADPLTPVATGITFTEMMAVLGIFITAAGTMITWLKKSNDRYHTEQREDKKEIINFAEKTTQVCGQSAAAMEKVAGACDRLDGHIQENTTQVRSFVAGMNDQKKFINGVADALKGRRCLLDKPEKGEIDVPKPD